MEINISLRRSKRGYLSLALHCSLCTALRFEEERAGAVTDAKARTVTWSSVQPIRSSRLRYVPSACLIGYLNSYNRSQQDALFLNCIVVNNSTCFGQT